MLTAKPDFWKTYYEGVAAEGDPWLDCSNQRTHLQTIAAALEAAGSVIGKRCLELGCGRGHLSRCLDVLGGEELTAVDLVDDMLSGFAEQHPQIDWRCLDASDQDALERLGRFDLVFAIEVLQYLPIADTLRFLMERLTPGGRLVALVPNAGCPLVQKAVDRFDGAYVPGDVGEIKETFDACGDAAWWACRGLTFADDQRITPYELSAWSDDPHWATPPNRLLLVAEKPAA